MTDQTIKFVHCGEGQSEWLPPRSETEGTADEWHPMTDRVEFDHTEATTCIVYRDGTSITTDCEGFVWSEEGGEEFITEYESRRFGTI